MRVFVTGGSGFVGQHVIRLLVADGHQVSALARSYRAADTVREAGAEPIGGDMADLTAGETRVGWTDALAGVDAVVHVAAFMEFWGPDDLFRRANLEPTIAFHRAAADADVRRFVLVSAASVASGSQRAAVVGDTTDEGRPNIAYSRVKLATERALLAADTPEMETVILRPPFIWGAGMTTVNEMADAAKAGRFMWIDHGRHIMDFVHVANLAHAVGRALTLGRHGGIYYVTDGTPMQIREFLTPLLATQGVDIRGSRSVPYALAAPFAATLDAAYRALRRAEPPMLTNWLVTFLGRDRSYDITSARTELGYTPQVPLAQGLAEMTAGYTDVRKRSSS
jgi:nucleoside-diphosphate-sugar epimerase